MTVTTHRYSLGTFSIAGSPPFPGLVIDKRVIALHMLAPLCKTLGVELFGAGSMLELLEYWRFNEKALQSAVDTLVADPASALLTDVAVPVSRLKVHAPIQNPRQFFCAGANYRKHVIDLIVDQNRDPAAAALTETERRAYAEALMDQRASEGTPYIFTQPVTSICGPYDDVMLQQGLEQPDWELELAVVIGRDTFQVSEEDALEHVAGYTIVNDISNRELVHRTDLKAIGSDWVMGKGLPTYSPMGPFIVPASQIADPQQLQITLKLNGEVMQDESTADMIFPVAKLIAYLSSRIRLLPGDILITGSPSGNGSHYNRFLRPGDKLESSILGLGVQRNCCIAEGYNQ
ncbi:MAG: 5-carboxymethyl-2-hydroxymuconate isomerase [Oceanospirillaceae bacterium]|nr:5-carboxymethyl-2-hydroxymuconate isomerase [Oceanospirillaceae bacterium]